MIGNNKYADCLEYCLVHSNCLRSQSGDSGDGDGDDDCTEDTDDSDDDPEMIIVIIRKKSEAITVHGSDMSQLTLCVSLFKIKKEVWFLLL